MCAIIYIHCMYLQHVNFDLRCEKNMPKPKVHVHVCVFVCMYNVYTCVHVHITCNIRSLYSVFIVYMYTMYMCTCVHVHAILSTCYTVLL